MAGSAPGSGSSRAATTCAARRHGERQGFWAAGVGGGGLAIALVRRRFGTRLARSVRHGACSPSPSSSASRWRRATGRRASVAGSRPGPAAVLSATAALPARHGPHGIVRSQRDRRGLGSLLLKHDGYGRSRRAVGALALLGGLVTSPRAGCLQPARDRHPAGRYQYVASRGNRPTPADLRSQFGLQTRRDVGTRRRIPSRRPSSCQRRDRRQPRSGSSTAARRSSSWWVRRWSG